MLLSPELPIASLHIGITLRREGRLGEALFWYKRAVQRDPNNAAVWRQLADLYRDRDEPSEAIPCWRRVIELNPEDPVGATIGLGQSLQDEGRLTEAMEQFDLAVSLNPDSCVAVHSKGSLHEIKGEMAEAEQCFRNAIRLDPEAAAGHAKLATLLRGDLPDHERTVLEHFAAREDTSTQTRARLLSALAQVADATGDYSRAADCMNEANTLTINTRKHEPPYSPQEHARFVRSLVNQFNEAFFDRTASHGHSSRRPVFVFGLPRSGTTLIEQVLASHPNIHGAGELRLARQTFDSISAQTGRSGSPVDCITFVQGNDIYQLAERHLQSLEALAGPDAPRVVDKMPDNYLFLGLLACLFPNALFVHCRRDLRDIGLSCFMTDFRSIRWANRLDHILSRFLSYQYLMQHWNSVLPIQIHEIHYRDTVNNLESVTRRLLDACGVDWDPACLEFYRTARAVRTASITQVRKPIYKTSLARWKNYETYYREFFGALAQIEATAPQESDLVGVPIGNAAFGPEDDFVLASTGLAALSGRTELPCDNADSNDRTR